MRTVEAQGANICEFGMGTENRCMELFHSELVIWNETDTEAKVIKLCSEHYIFATEVAYDIKGLRNE